MARSGHVRTLQLAPDDHGIPVPTLDVSAALQEHAAGVIVSVRVVPRASRTAIVGMHGRSLKVKVHAPPVDGAANDAVRTVLADSCDVPVRDVEILMGSKSRDKVVLVRGCGVADLRYALQALL